MKKILASLFCLALLAGPSFANGEKCSSDKSAASCCSQKAQKQTAKKDCCKKMAKKSAKKSCCASKQTAKKDCGPSCKITDTWMMEKADCKACETASL